MKLRTKSQSIVGRIDKMSRMLTVMLVVPVVISLVLMLLFSDRYYRSIERMSAIASLKPEISEVIPDEVWNVVSGRVTVEDSDVFDRINAADATIERIIGETGDNDKLALTVARRTMDTLEQYTTRIRDNVLESVPTVESEEILTEVRNVASLVESMLNDYITGEINESAATGVYLTRTVLITAGAEILLVIICLLISRRARKNTGTFVREPIKELESVTAKLAGGDLQARIPETEVTELKTLTDQVNEMAENMEKLMQQSIKDERSLKKAELRTLQAQINPHFLYNTLDAIVWKAEAGEEDEVIRLTRALSDFFRISLSSGADWIPISQEKKHINGYLMIQQTRYRDILKYEIDIPDELDGYYVLKLLLQPLVENALYHGIKYKRGGGIIRIKAEKDGDHLMFTVSDTGSGMTEERLREVRQRINARQPVHSTGSGGFGLVNVDLRIRLYYNEPEGLRIESGPNGTVIRLRVPCRTEEDLADDQGISG